jgi:Zn-dependent peptidase ImmA (M78 family)
LSHEEAAHSLHVKVEKLQSWEVENAQERPSMAQLRNMAKTYRRALSDFFLPSPPSEPPLPHDFRRLPGDGSFHYGRILRYQLREARSRRALALDLAAEQDIPLQTLPVISPTESTESLGDKVRLLLRVTMNEQRTWRDPRKSYNAWRNRVESLNVLVFQVTGVKPDEMLGFSIAEQPLPIIGINRKLAPNGRTFTLMHEFVHLLLRESSLCDIEDSFVRKPQEQKTEVFCNAVGAAALVPLDALRKDPIISPHPKARDWADDELIAVARNFGVSTHVILRRLLTAGLTTEAFYAKRAARWRIFEPPPKRDEEDEFRRNMPQEVVSDLGRPFVSMLLESYLSSNLSLTDTSRYLGLRAGQVQKVKELVFGA